MNSNNAQKGIKFIQFIPGIAWFILVTVLLCIPGKDLPDIDFLEQIDFDKFVHASLFGMLTILFCLPYRKSSHDTSEKKIWFIKIAMSACIWGITTEIIQKYFIPGRTFDWLDWAADSTGTLAGYIFCNKFFLKKK